MVLSWTLSYGHVVGQDWYVYVANDGPDDLFITSVTYFSCDLKAEQDDYHSVLPQKHALLLLIHSHGMFTAAGSSIQSLTTEKYMLLFPRTPLYKQPVTPDRKVCTV